MAKGIYWNGDAWVKIEIDSPFDKSRTFIQSTPPADPTPVRVGDLYIDAATSKTQYFDGTAWVDLMTTQSTIIIPDVDGLTEAIAGLSPIGHNHTISEIINLSLSLNEKAELLHSHNATDISGGVLSISTIPTGTSSSTVAFGDHDHILADITDVTVSTAEVNSLTGVSSSVQGQLNSRSLVGHIHPATDVTGVLNVSTIPNLDTAKITSGTLAVARLPVATTAAAGISAMATNAEALAMTNAAKFLTPASMSYALTNLPRARGYRDTSFAKAAGYVRLSGLVEEYDTANILNAATGLFTAPAAGMYLFIANVNFDNDSTRRLIQIEEGVAAPGDASNTPLARAEGSATGYSTLSCSAEVYLTANDTVSVAMYSAAATNIRADLSPASISIRKVA